MAFVAMGHAAATTVDVNVRASVSSIVPTDVTIPTPAGTVTNKGGSAILFVSPVTVQSGDVINLDILFDASMTTVPANVATSYGAAFMAGSPRGTINDVTSTASLFFGGAPVHLGSQVRNTSVGSSAMGNQEVVFAPNATAFTFDELRSQILVTSLTRPTTFQVVQFSYVAQSISTVPEPLSGLLFAIGLPLVGFAGFAKRH